MVRYLSMMITLCSLAGQFPSEAEAQLPIPLPGQEPRLQKKDTQPEKKTTPKTYKAPKQRSLPAGEAKVLSGPVVLVNFDGIVNPGMGEYTIDAIKRAEKEGAQAVLIELDTPGGLVSTTQKIVQSILGAKVPVIVHVGPSGAHAASAGTFITLAAHVAAMAPASRIGAAHPVTGGGKDPEAEGGKHLGKKIENDLVALVEGIARERNRNAEWAIDAVRESVSAHTDQALEIGVIDLIARDRNELFAKLEGRQFMVAGEKVELHLQGSEILAHEMSLRTWLLNLLANPGIAMILGVLGLIGVMVEIYHPGMIAPGVMGVLCILCSLIAMEQMPIDVGAALLVIAGIGLLIAEVYTPTYGALGILGAIGLSLGLVLLVDTERPDFAIDSSFELSFWDVLPIVLTFVGFVVYLSTLVVRMRSLKPITGQEALVGALGQVLQAVGPTGGQVFVSGEYWDAASEGVVEEGAEVEVVRIEGLRLFVKPTRSPQVS